MISQEKAIEIILSNAQQVDSEFVELHNATGRILYEDIFSDIDMPPFRKSAVDGYACRREDLTKPMLCIETIVAGKNSDTVILPGTCAKIMTGAMIPKNADTVIMVEDTIISDNNMVLFSAEKTSPNICEQGEDIKLGSLVLTKGTILKPYHIAILASVGIYQVPVSRKVRVGIIITGSELKEPNEPLEHGKIRNSNGFMLVSCCIGASSLPKYYGIIEDNLEIIVNTIQMALSENDIVLVTGGVSMGDFDFVPQALQMAGLQIKFEKISMQPGKPLTYAYGRGKHCFGLPGNPVSSFVQFEFSVKPLINKLSGNAFAPVFVPMKMGKNITRTKAERKSVYPVLLNENGEVIPVEYHGSAHINAFSNAFGLISLEQGIYELKKGETVHVRLL